MTKLEKLKAEYERKLATLRGKHLKVADKGQAVATKAGKLDEALAWKAWVEELEARGVVQHWRLAGTRNVAPQATIIASSLESNPARVMVDGELANLKDVRAHRRQYWASAESPAPSDPSWSLSPLPGWSGRY